jgi:hypothetical protein
MARAHVVRLGDKGWDEDDDHSVDAIVREHGPQRPLVVVSGGRCNQIDGIPHGGGSREERTQFGLGEGRELGRFEPGSLGCVCGQNAGPARVAHDRHAGACREWLVNEHLRHVKQLLQRVDPDHTGLAKEGVDRDVGARQGGGV